MITFVKAIYFDGTYFVTFNTQADRAIAAVILAENNISYAVDGDLEVCSNDDEDSGDYTDYNPDDGEQFDWSTYDEDDEWYWEDLGEEIPEEEGDEIYKDKSINPNAKTKIAIIDTGSNKANEAYSVIGTSVADDNGHGTEMANIILNQTDDAYIISIKALNADGKGQMSDIYAAVQLAESMNVDYILMAISIRDNGKYDAFKELITNTKAKVVASAGNNGTDASKYLPASIDKVYTAAATDEDDVIMPFSNYGTCVDYYVDGDSTSESAAITAGLLIAGEYINTYGIVGEHYYEEGSEYEFDTDSVSIKYGSTKYYYAISAASIQSVASKRTTAQFYSRVLSYGATKVKNKTKYSGGCIDFAIRAWQYGRNKSGSNFTNTIAGHKFVFDETTGCTTFMKTKAGIKPNASCGVAGFTYKTTNTSDAKTCGKAFYKYITTYGTKGDMILGSNNKDTWVHAMIYAGTGKESFGGKKVNAIKVYEVPGKGKAARSRLISAADFHTSMTSKSMTRAVLLKAQSTVTPMGGIKLTKAVSTTYNNLITNNNCYSLDGTTYGIFSDAACTDENMLIEFTMDASGACSTLYTPTVGSTYYLKELEHGDGFRIDSTIYRIHIDSNTQITIYNDDDGTSKTITASNGVFNIALTDEPVGDPFRITLRKVDNFGKPVNGATMDGAVFVIEYYDIITAGSISNDDDVDGDDDDGTATGDGEGDGEDLGDAGGTDDDSGEQDVDEDIENTSPIVIYEIPVNSNNTNKISLKTLLDNGTVIGGTNQSYFVNIGDSTEYELPIGTYRIYEKTAPSGYTKNEQIIQICIYQSEDDPDETLFQYTVETENGSSRFWNHTLDGSDINLVLAEAPEVGYYELTKKIPAGEYDVSGFEFELWNKTNNIQIATGISQTNGKVLWTYVVEGYKSNTDPTVTLTGTTTEKLELALGPSNARIEYEVREKEKTDVKYKAVVPVQFITPTISGKSVTLGQGYYSIIETFTENGQTISREFNNTPKAITALKIRKSDTSNDGIARTFTFDIYYLGNGTTASTTINEYVESVSVTTNTAGEGTATIKGLPTGWYKVVEKTNDLKITYPNGQIVDATGYNDTITFDVVNSSTPKIGTTLVDSQTNDHIGIVSTSTKLVDTISYSGLFSGTYKVTGTLYNKATGQPFLINGQKITGTAEFTLEKQVNAYGIEVQQNGTVDVEYIFDSTGLKGISLVAFEELYLGNELVVEHKDINDEGQTISFPDIHTVLLDTASNKNIALYAIGQDIKLVDTIYYTNLVPNKQYKVSGILVSRSDNGTVTTYTGSREFTPTTKDGTITVDFTVPYDAVRGKILVAYESLSFGNIDIVEDNDINNEAETIYIPEIKTTLVDNATGEHITTAVEKEITLTDTVEYTSLKPGVEYLMTGTLMDKKTGEPLKDKSGNPIYGSTKFTPNNPNGTVDVVFKFTGVNLNNTTIVAFEDLKQDGVTVAIHTNIDDYDQTVFVPDIHTTFYDLAIGEKAVGDGETLTSFSKTAKLVDRVYYENVVPNKEYTLVATVMVKSTGEKLLDANNTPYTVTKTFTPTDKSGYVDVEFEIDTTIVPNTSLVCFETLKFGTVELVIHSDINDVDQTVKIPEIKTTATDKVDGDKMVDGTKTAQTIVDTVKYDNLIINKEYTITGKLVVKKDYAEGEEPEYVKDSAGNIVTATKTFTATATSGSETLEFTFDASKYAGEELVVFEDLYYKNVLITTHSDITDKDQTIEVSLLLHIKIAKMDGKNIKYVLKNAEITIYRVALNANGELVKDAKGNVIYEVVKDKDGKDCIGMTDTDGFVDFTVVWDRNFKYFAKETKAPRGYSINDKYFEVVPTKDRESEGVCLIPIQIVDFAIPPRTGDTTPVSTLAGIALVAIAVVTAGAIFIINKKKANKPTETTTNTSDKEE